MAGRPPGPTGVRLTDEHRAKIQNSNILNRLISHAEGSIAMKPTEVQAALGLLKKSLPDLTATQHSGDPERPVHHKVEHVIVDAKG